MTTSVGTIPILELRKLLHAIRDRQPDVGIRFRMMGEMWQSQFSRIIHVSKHTLLLKPEGTERLMFIRNMNTVMQFELDQAFQQYQPYFHYAVDPPLDGAEDF